MASKNISFSKNLPVSFISSILQCLDVFFVVMLIKTLHFPCITFLNPSHQGWIILLNNANKANAKDFKEKARCINQITRKRQLNTTTA